MPGGLYQIRLRVSFASRPSMDALAALPSSSSSSTASVQRKASLHDAYGAISIPFPAPHELRHTHAQPVDSTSATLTREERSHRSAAAQQTTTATPVENVTGQVNAGDSVALKAQERDISVHVVEAPDGI